MTRLVNYGHLKVFFSPTGAPGNLDVELRAEVVVTGINRLTSLYEAVPRVVGAHLGATLRALRQLLPGQHYEHRPAEVESFKSFEYDHTVIRGRCRFTVAVPVPVPTLAHPGERRDP